MKQPLNYNWSFVNDFQKEYLEKLPDKKEIIDVPHNIHDVPYNYFDEKIYQKVVTYEKIFDVDDDLTNKSSILHFEGFMLQADIYLNDHFLGHFISGYFPVKIDVSEFIKKKDNRLLVILDSNEDKNIPPFGFAVDYLTFSGIYREVSLETHLSTYLDNFYINASSNGEVEIIYDVKGKDHLSIEHEIYDRECLFHSSSDNKFRCVGMTLWDVDNPYLYTLKTIVKVKDKEEIYYHKFGFRSVRFKNDGFYLNDKKVHLIGLNRHQLYPYVGAAMPKSMQEEDALLLKEIGCNIVRESHYPQSEHFLNKCDEIGLLVINEVPGWQHISKENIWRETYYDFVKRLVLKERNHLSLIAYGVRIDESKDDHELYLKGNEIAHQYDKFRQTLGVRNSKESELLEDIYAYNDFTCWNMDKGVEDPKKVKKQNSPYLISEYMGHMDPLKPTADIEKAQEVALHHLRVIDDSFKYERISGCIGWCFVDYYTHVDFGSGDHICAHGVLDMFRNKKYSSYSYEIQQDNHPFLEILSNMKPGDFPVAIYRDIYIFTNMDYVKLYKNDGYVTTYYPNHHEFKNIKHPPIKVDDILGETFDDHRFTKKDNKMFAKVFSYGGIYGYGNLPTKYKLFIAKCFVKYKLTWDDLIDIWNTHIATWGGYAKTFKYVGYKDDKEVISRTIAPYLKFHYQFNYKRDYLLNEDSYDVLPIRVSLRDEFGALMNYAERSFTIETKGPIKLIGPKIQSLIGGQITVYIRSLHEKGKGKVIITFPGEVKEIELEVK